MKQIAYHLLPVLGLCSLLGLSSCKPMGRMVGKNYAIVSDHVTTPQADDVSVENGHAGEARLPGAAPVPAPATIGRQITVQPGDTLSGIARRSSVSLSALCAANGLTPSSPIRSGQRLNIPGAAARPATPPGPGSALYTVKPGETLSGIASRHGVSVAAIIRANGMTPAQADRIRSGQTLRIPRK